MRYDVVDEAFGTIEDVKEISKDKYFYEIQDIVKEYGVDILPEIHEHYTIQHKMAEKGFWIYDFALQKLMEVNL